MMTQRGETRNLSSKIILAALVTAPAILAMSLSWGARADIYWDGANQSDTNDAGTGAGLGGGGSWDTGTANWWDGSSGSDQTWNDAGADNAIFWGPSAGNITLAADHTVGSLDFRTSNYLI